MMSNWHKSWINTNNCHRKQFQARSYWIFWRKTRWMFKRKTSTDCCGCLEKKTASQSVNYWNKSTNSIKSSTPITRLRKPSPSRKCSVWPRDLTINIGMPTISGWMSWRRINTNNEKCYNYVRMHLCRVCQLHGLPPAAANEQTPVDQYRFPVADLE